MEEADGRPQRDGRRQRGDATRLSVLAVAADLASNDGLDGLSIGRLASATGLSKSGVATLFGTKERLQIATVEFARQRYIEVVIEPARLEPRGIRRIARLLDAWIAYSRDRVFPGGCFFSAAIVDVDGKPGAVHDVVARVVDDWYAYMTVSIARAVDLGELDADTDAVQLAFECAALLEAANSRSVMTGSPIPYEWARRGLVSRLLAAGAARDLLAGLAQGVDDERVTS